VPAGAHSHLGTISAMTDHLPGGTPMHHPPGMNTGREEGARDEPEPAHLLALSR
jgi:hypothetical protein